MRDACLWSSSHMQVVASPMGVSRGMAHHEGRPPHQHGQYQLPSALHSTSPHVNPTGHASICNACLQLSSGMQAVSGPMGVCGG